MAKGVELAVYTGDITNLALDAIVNAANPQLESGGGVCGAIHKAAGPELLAECRALGGCPTGEARITRAYRLPAKWIIHAVGPVWQGEHDNHDNEDALLAACYRNALHVAQARYLGSIAFPAISKGIYGFPLERATSIAVDTVRRETKRPGSLRRVIFACFNLPTAALYKRVLQEGVDCYTN